MIHAHPIIQADVSDAERIAPLFDAYRRFYLKPAAPEACAQWLRDRLSRNEATIYVAFMPADVAPAEPPLCVADHRGTPAGIVVLYPSFSSVALAPRLTLNDLFVDQAYRRQGLAKQLLLRSMLLATELNASLQLLTAHTNHQAQALYAATGWKLDQTYQRWTWTPPT